MSKKNSIDFEKAVEQNLVNRVIVRNKWRKHYGSDSLWLIGGNA